MQSTFFPLIIFPLIISVVHCISNGHNLQTALYIWCQKRREYEFMGSPESTNVNNIF